MPWRRRSQSMGSRMSRPPAWRLGSTRTATRERDAAYETIQAFSGDEGGAELRSRVDLLSAVLEGAEPGDLTAWRKSMSGSVRRGRRPRPGLRKSARGWRPGGVFSNRRGKGESGQKRRCTIFRPAVTRPAPGLS